MRGPRLTWSSPSPVAGPILGARREERWHPLSYSVEGYHPGQDQGRTDVPLLPRKDPTVIRYTAGGALLAVTQEDFLVLWCIVFVLPLFASEY